MRAQTLDALRAVVGSSAQWLQDLSFGRDDRPVQPNYERKSCGSECTYEKDLTNLDEIGNEIAEMAREVARWLDRHAMFARTVVIKVRYEDFTTITRSHSVPRSTRDEADMIARARNLLAKTDAGRRPVRLLGVSVHNLEKTESTVRPRRTAVDPDARLPLEDDM